jgi:hypothetical protein
VVENHRAAHSSSRYRLGVHGDKPSQELLNESQRIWNPSAKAGSGGQSKSPAGTVIPHVGFVLPEPDLNPLVDFSMHESYDQLPAAIKGSTRFTTIELPWAQDS